MLLFENTVTEDWPKFELSAEKWQSLFFFLADSYEIFIKCYLFKMPNLCLSIAIVDFYWETTTQLQCS